MISSQYSVLQLSQSIRRGAVLLSLVIGLVLSSAVQANEAPKKVKMEVFWGITCGYCKQQKPFLAELEKNYPQLKIHQYEIYESVINRGMYIRTAQAHGVEAGGVPAVFVGGHYFYGDSPEIRTEIEAAVRAALAEKPKVEAVSTVSDSK